MCNSIAEIKYYQTGLKFPGWKFYFHRTGQSASMVGILSNQNGLCNSHHGNRAGYSISPMVEMSTSQCGSTNPHIIVGLFNNLNGLCDSLHGNLAITRIIYLAFSKYRWKCQLPNLHGSTHSHSGIFEYLEWIV